MARAARSPTRPTTACTATSARRTRARRGCTTRTARLKKNPLGVTLAGCPLNEKIGEMHVLRKEGDSLAALALIVIDNPMAPGTGHRICNDCMKACIFQKQEPVNIPQAETGVAHRRAGDAAGGSRSTASSRAGIRSTGCVPTRARTTARTCWWSGSARPATRSAHHLAQRRLRRGRHRRPQGRAAARGPARRRRLAAARRRELVRAGDAARRAARSRASAASPSTASPFAGTRTS